MTWNLAVWKAEDWSALGTCVTALVAVIAALFAGSQVREARRTREERSQPFVVVDIQPSRVWHNLLLLVVENIGATLARDVQISFQPALTTSLADSHLPSSALLREGITSLPPRRRIEMLFDISHDRLKADLPLRYDVTVKFKDARGRSQEPLRYVIDLAVLYDLEVVQERNVHHAAEALEKVSDTLKSWSTSGGMRVWLRDEDERSKRQRVEEDLTGHRPSLGRKPPSDLVMAVGRNVLVRTSVRRLRKAWVNLRPGPRDRRQADSGGVDPS
jgi:hypothetical protein